MVQREASGPLAMRDRDGQRCKAPGNNHRLQGGGKGGSFRQLPLPEFDRNFPSRSGADERLIIARPRSPLLPSAATSQFQAGTAKPHEYRGETAFGYLYHSSNSSSVMGS